MSTDLERIGAFDTIPAMTDAAIAHVRRLEDHMLATQEQFPVLTEHTLHAGLYSRTLRMFANTVITGALIKIPTLLITSGHCYVWLDGRMQENRGHIVMAAAAVRKTAFRAVKDTSITMVFPTAAKTVAEAEAEFTDEADRLMSRKPGALNVVNGEQS